MVTVPAMGGTLCSCNGIFTGALESTVSFFSAPLPVLKGSAGPSWCGSRVQFILPPYHLAYDPPLVLLCLLSKEMSCILPTEDGSLMNVK